MSGEERELELLWNDNWDTQYFPKVMRLIGERLIADRYTGMDSGIEDACRYMFLEGYQKAQEIAAWDAEHDE